MFENVIEAMVDAVLVVDVAGTITAANAAATRMTGYSATNLRGMSWDRLVLDEASGVRSSARRSVARRAVNGAGETPIEQSWVVTESGERIPVSVTGSPIISKAGELEGIVIVARDVREMRRALEWVETRLDETRTTLLLAERRATLGTLAGGVGHELRNIALVQMSIVEDLRTALDTDGDVHALVRDLLPDLARATEHITAHGQRLLQLARPEPEVVDDISLTDVCGNVVAMMRGSGKLRHVQLEVDLPEDKPLTVLASRTRIEQILVNLVTNAIDAIGCKDGVVTIRARANADRTRVCFEVTDSGPGIPLDAHDKIFEAYFTTKPPEQGTGLGLPVAKEIVESYGGTLAMTTSATGTTFTFDLPR